MAPDDEAMAEAAPFDKGAEEYRFTAEDAAKTEEPENAEKGFELKIAGWNEVILLVKNPFPNG